MEVQPYKVHIPETTLQDLNERLAHTRWPGDIPDSGWDYGSNLDYLQELVEYWRTGFDWRAKGSGDQQRQGYQKTGGTSVNAVVVDYREENGGGGEQVYADGKVGCQN